MSNSSEMPWFNNTNAPQIPSELYIVEKDTFAGTCIGAISYGIAVAVFFQCMGVLTSPTNPIRRGVKWALIAHTVAMFSFLTIPYGIALSNESVMYIDDREFPGDYEYPPGPIGYLDILSSGPTIIVFNIMFPLNQWLADGLLLHRCYVIYSMNYWVMAFPCLMYLTSVAMGIADIYEGSGARYGTVVAANFNTSYVSISLMLNVLLTVMIVVRLVRHVRNVRKVTGASSGSHGLHTATATVVTMLVESYALYAVALLVYIVPWAINSPVLGIFNAATGTIQVIAQYLIILRVANRRALTSESITGTIGSIHFQSQLTTDDERTIPDGDSTNSTEVNNETSGELGAGAEVDVMEEVP